MLSTRQRLWILAGASLTLFGGLLVRLIDLQVVRADYYDAVATSQRQRAAELAPSRGTIYVQEQGSQELFPVAANSSAHIAYAVPRSMEDPAAVAAELAPALDAYHERQKGRLAAIIEQTGQNLAPTPSVTPSPSPTTAPEDVDRVAILREELYRKFNKKADPYEPFLKFYEVLDDELRQFLEERQLPGIILEEQPIRIYPEKTLAAHVLGYVGWQDDRKIGRYGIEEQFEESLRGDQGFLSLERDAGGALIGVGAREFQAAQDGADVVLTIDRVVQSIIEDELADGVRRYGAERGSVIVMNPKTGAVLGTATYPSYDPNYYYAIADANTQRDPTISEIFEPGSILKPLIMAIAIEEAKVTPETTMVDSGPVKVDKYTINTYDGKHHGRQTMTQVLEQSNNIGMVWVGQQLGAELMYDYLRRFGFGEKMGIELANETASSLIEPEAWNVATIATVAFGQGIAVTPLQALNAMNTLANGGSLMQPYVVARLREQDGQEHVTEPTVVRPILSPGTAADVTAMLVSVIENGVATLARVPGYYLAGKTGTAQVPDEKGAYSPDRKIISFVGFGPVRDPRFSIMVKLDNPAGLSFASGTAAPMFRHIAEKLLNYYQLKPDYDAEQKPAPYKVTTSGGDGA